MNTTDQITALLGEILKLGDRRNILQPSTALLGSLPELDSMAVATVIAGIEDRFDIIIDDDELSAEVFGTVGSLVEFVDHKLAG